MGRSAVSVPPKSPNRVADTTTTTNNSRHLHTPIPRSRTNSRDSDTGSETKPSSPHRVRFNSRDIQQQQRSYNHNEVDETDLLPLECMKQQQYFQSKLSFSVFLSTYMTLILIIYLSVSFITPTQNNHYAWTITNIIHLFLTIVYVHWIKGSWLFDEQGELNAMTLWEQLEATPESATHMRRILLIIPTVLAYTSCIMCEYELYQCTLNIVVWSISMLAKLPIMNGVRIFGINRTAGIDDGIIIGDNGNKKQKQI